MGHRNLCTLAIFHYSQGDEAGTELKEPVLVPTWGSDVTGNSLTSGNTVLALQFFLPKYTCTYTFLSLFLASLLR